MDPRPAFALHVLSDDELLRRLGDLVEQAHRVEADLVAHIGEVDGRRLFSRFAFPSMFAYCTQHLHLSEAEAYRRITVARAARLHPSLLVRLRDGRLHLSGAATLVPLLTTDNAGALLDRATHLTKRQIEELVAELSPRPDVASRIRRLPEPRTIGLESAARPRSGCPPRDAAVVGGNDVAELVPGRVVADRTSVSPNHLAVPTVTPAACSTPTASTSRGPAVEPLSPGRYKVQFTASSDLRDKLERLAALMRSEVPDGDLGAILELAVTEKLERLEARRFGRTASARKSLASTAPATRHVPAAVRRAVRKRDDGRCRYVDEQGRRCSERHRLEYHHRHPFGMGGSHDLDNISLLCPAHNRRLAEYDYGTMALGRHLTEQTEIARSASAQDERPGRGSCSRTIR
jgi:hypothetical protein